MVVSLPDQASAIGIKYDTQEGKMTKESDLHVASADVRADVQLDVRGLSCPLPILRTKKALAELSSGQSLCVQATDPGSVKDFAAFCRHTGNTLEHQSERDGVYVFVIRRK